MGRLWTRWGWIAAWALLTAVSLPLRDPLPIDETRYLAVAWEMWLRQDFLVPYLNGEVYSHKPPLLFWLIHAGWTLFGVNDWWPRLVAPAFALAALFGTRFLARRLWPEQRLEDTASWLLAGSLFWALYTPATMFDMLVVSFTVLGMSALVLTVRSRHAALAWSLYGLAIGLGVLAKGPVILLHLLFPALLGPWWSDAARSRPGRWYGSLLAALALGGAIAAAWVVPAILRAGSAYETAILWHQTADRMVHSFAHSHAWWWYLPLLPVLLFPWLLWPPLWRGVKRLRLDAGSRFCIAWLLPVLVALMLISAKQPHYLLPVFPVVALLAARALAQAPGAIGARAQWLPALFLVAVGLLLLLAPHVPKWPDWTRALGWPWAVALVGLGAGMFALRRCGALAAVAPMASVSIAAVVIFEAALFPAVRPLYDLHPAARYIADLQHRGVAVAHAAKYHGQYQFTGRLREPLQEISVAELPDWLAAHPGGRVVYYTERAPTQGAEDEFVGRYRGQWIHIRPASAGLPTRVAHALRDPGSSNSASARIAHAGSDGIDGTQ